MRGGYPDGKLGDARKSTSDNKHIPSSDNIGAISSNQTTEKTWGLGVESQHFVTFLFGVRGLIPGVDGKLLHMTYLAALKMATKY